MAVLIWFGLLVAGLWSAGCFGLPLYTAWWLWFEDEEKGMAAFVLLLGWPLGVFAAVFPWAIICHESSPDLATLKKNEWVCFSSHPVVTTTVVPSGKVMIPVTSTHQVCDQYNRKN